MFVWQKFARIKKKILYERTTHQNTDRNASPQELKLYFKFWMYFGVKDD